MPQMIKMIMALLVAGFVLAACGPGADTGAGGDTTTEETAPTDGTNTQ